MATIASVSEMLQTFAADVKAEFANLRKTCKEMKDQVTAIEKGMLDLQTENKELQVRMDTMESKVEFLERQLKKNNIIYFGIDEANEETPNQLEQKALDVMSDKMQVNIKSDDIANVYRIGKRNGRFPRPVFIALANYKKKAEIIANRSKLRGTDIFVNDDLTPKQRETRKNLQQHARRLREEGKRVSIRAEKIVVHEDSYDVNELNASYKEVSEAEEELGLTPSTGTSDGLRREILERTLRPRIKGNKTQLSKN